MQSLERLPGPVEAGVAQPAGEAIVLNARPRVDHTGTEDHRIEDFAQGGQDARTVGDGKIAIRSRGVGPTEIQATAQEPLVVRNGLAKPEVAGIVPEISDAEVFDGHDPARVHVFIVDARVYRLGAGLSAGSRGVPRGRSGRLEMGGAHDSRRAEHLVRLAQDAKHPLFAASVRVVFLGFLAVGVADLLKRRFRRHAENFERVNLEAELRHFGRMKDKG